METIEIISPRQLQRDYKTLIDKVKKTKKPLFIGSKGKFEIAIINAEQYLYNKPNPITPNYTSDDFFCFIDTMRKKGDKKTDLLKALRNDRDTV